ncbi:DUF4349 domain-containing protein [Sorangium atrum]|uniref:DUF4349 domain-containing protein n=1 Tax=Sorangium atrum TaxID=2995308 RepID=A0ABT5C2U0_9BACT|nr:DUF4349 domain-containing protein [Sorangium aterium]MDC0679506.1 DUF4349 domain-containing protein [Sorangium aterium]
MSLSAVLLSAVALMSSCAREDRSKSAPPEPAAAVDRREQGPSSAAAPLTGRAMRITVETAILVDAFEPAMQRLRTAVEEHGGYVSEARVHGGPHRSASLEARVPSAKVGAFRAAVASVGEVVDDAEKAEDVTEQRADIGARLRNARAQEKRLLDLLSDRTGSLADVVAVEKQLGSVRETIEQIEAQERLLEGQIAYATVKMSITARGEEQTLGAGGKIARAAGEGIENAGVVAVKTAVLAASIAPTLLLLAAFFGALYYALRAIVRRQRRTAASFRPPFQAGPMHAYPSGAPPAQGAQPYPSAAPPAQGAQLSPESTSPPPAQGPRGDGEIGPG